MSLVDLQTARDHLRVDADYPDEQVVPYLYAAERLVTEFLNRRIYADDAALSAAVAAVPAAVTAASIAYEDALEAAADIEDRATYEAFEGHATRTYERARTLARETYDGIVMNDALTAAILLTLSSLHENRGDDGGQEAMPRAAIALAYPFRVGLGV